MAEEKKLIDEGLQSDVLGYPKHVASFETYYFLGEMRSLKMAAKIRFQQLVPDCPPDSPKFSSKFESFYTKIKRWAKSEDWNGWCIRKDVEERTKRGKEMRSKMVSMDKTLKTYQSLVRQSLIVWSDKIRASVELRTALAKGDDAAIIELKGKARLEITSFKEAKDMMELDLYLSRILEQMPEIPTEAREKLSEEHSRRIDVVMELIRKRAFDTVEANGKSTKRKP